ncbi:hypothetical protein D9M68_450140 [compost metagenome]
MRPVASTPNTVQKVTGITRCIAARQLAARCGVPMPASTSPTTAADNSASAAGWRRQRFMGFRRRTRVNTSYEVMTLARAVHRDNPVP